MWSNTSNSISGRVIRYIDNSNIKEINNFVKSESIEELFNLKLGENNMTIVHKIVISNNYLLLNGVLAVLEKKIQKKKLSSFLNTPDDEGNIPLHYAAFKGNLDIISLLISYGSNYNIKSGKGLNMIHMAAQGDQLNAIIYFKEQLGMSIHSTDYSGSTPLHWAIYTSSKNSVNFLLAFGIDVNAQDYNGQTPLHLAVFIENEAIIKALIAKGGDINIKNKEGKTPLNIELERNAFGKSINLLQSNRKIKHYCFESASSSIKGNRLSSISFFCILFAIMISIYYFLIPYIDRLYFGLLFGSFIILLIASGYICYSNPGIAVNKYSNESWLDLSMKKIKIEALCPYCKANVGPLTKHCFQCNLCVYEHYYHCNWMNNCIGESNYKMHLLFLIVLLVDIGFFYFVSLVAFMINSNATTPATTIFHLTAFFTVPYWPLLKNIMAITIMTICIGLFGIILFIFIKQIRKKLIHMKLKEI